MSNIEDHAAGEIRHYGMLIGQVVERKDPRGLHRVRVMIPGIAEPDEVAGLVTYLLSDDARFITGSTFSIDGGQAQA